MPQSFRQRSARGSAVKLACLPPQRRPLRKRRSLFLWNAPSASSHTTQHQRRDRGRKHRDAADITTQTSVDSNKPIEQNKNDYPSRLHMMLNRPAPQTPFAKAFDDWWRSQSPTFLARMDQQLARSVFRAGYACGQRKEKQRFVFKVGKFRITVWATSVREAKRLACIEADSRASARKGKAPAGGWSLEQI